MIQNSTLNFLKNLKSNNNKEWFNSHKNDYVKSKSDFEKLVESIFFKLMELDDNLAKNVEQAKKVFRINRDVRFSKDKSPYKTNFGAWFSKNAKAMDYAGFYIHIEPQASGIAGGIYMPESKKLNEIRNKISKNYEDFLDVIGDSSFQKYFSDLQKDESLKRPPKGFNELDPAMEYLKLKSFTVWFPLTDKDVQSKNLEEKIMNVFREIKKLNDFFN